MSVWTRRPENDEYHNRDVTVHDGPRYVYDTEEAAKAKGHVPCSHCFAYDPDADQSSEG